MLYQTFFFTGLSLDRERLKQEKLGVFLLDNFRPKLMTYQVLKVVGRLWQLEGKNEMC